MRAILLAAGVGRRIGGEEGHPPKCLLQFGGKSLLHRHLELLRHCGIQEIVLGIGFKAEMIKLELDKLGANGFARTVFNPRYEEGSNLTLWSLRDELTKADELLLMDADVLYEHRMIKTLLNTSHKNCFLMDRGFQPGSEPMKLCVRGEKLVEFRKLVEVAFDFCGESVGFFLLKNNICRKLLKTCERFTKHPEECYEEALRDVLLQSPSGTFGYEDITGLPWTEIDFPEDVKKAREMILPFLEAIHHA